MNEAESLGQYLRREREARGISLREVAKNTRVRESLLKAMEEDRHDLLPAPTIVKGFLNAYAKYVGLNPHDLILRYQNAPHGQPAPSTEPPTPKRLEEKPKQRRYWLGFIVAGVVVLGLILAYLYYLQPSQPTPPKPQESVSPKPEEPAPAQPETSTTIPPAPSGSPVSASPVPSSIPSTPISSAPVPPSVAATVSAKEQKPLSLQLKAVEKTWLTLQLDNEPEKEMMLQPGETLSYQAADRIQLYVGNAGGLDLVFNGKNQGRFGKSGEVVTITFTPQGADVKRYEKRTNE
jgi:cytoskeleton protein RodZ